MPSHLDHSSFKALHSGVEKEEKGQMFLLEHFLAVSPSEVNYSVIPLASHFHFMAGFFRKSSRLKSKESISALKQ